MVSRDGTQGAEACPTANDKCVTMTSAAGGGTALGCSSHAQKALSNFACDAPGNSVEFMGVQWQTQCCQGELCNEGALQTSTLSLRRVHAVTCHASKAGGAFAVVAGGPGSSVGGISIADSTISECSASLGGGAIVALAMLSGFIGPFEMTDSRMSNCSAAPRSGDGVQGAWGYGGALALLSLDAVVSQVHLSGLEIAYCNASGAAGAMMAYSEGRFGAIKMQKSRISHCNGTSAGGVVIIGSVTGGEDVEMQNLVVEQCHATAVGMWDDDGGDMSSIPLPWMVVPMSGGLRVGVVPSGHVLLRETVVTRCSAWSGFGWGGGIMLGSWGGGIMFPGTAKSYVLDGVIVESCGGWLAGGVFFWVFKQEVYIKNSIISNNSACYGGGMGVWAPASAVIGPNVSISYNDALAAGGGTTVCRCV